MLEEFRKANGIPSFEEYLEDGMEAQVLAFAESFGVAEDCKGRGLDKLSRIPSIRALIGLGMSFMYRTSESLAFGIWIFRFVTEEDEPLPQALLEMYVVVVLKTPHNSFESLTSFSTSKSGWNSEAYCLFSHPKL